MVECGQAGHDPPGKATEGGWQQVTLNLGQGSGDVGIGPVTGAQLGPAGHTVLDKGRILQKTAISFG